MNFTNDICLVVFLITGVLPEAIETKCAECSDKQKEGSKKMFKFLIEKRPEEWKSLEAKYDPNGHYKAKYDAGELE